MSKQRQITLAVSVVIAAVGAMLLLQIYPAWPEKFAYAAYIFLTFYFLGILISNQQYEEDFMAKIERVASAAVFSYIFFIQLIYAPLARYFFGQLIEKQFFLSDLLALLLFLLFLVLFGVTAAVVSRFSRQSLFPRLVIFNNQKMYFFLRGLWPAMMILAVYLYWRNPFFIIAA